MGVANQPANPRPASRGGWGAARWYNSGPPPPTAGRPVVGRLVGYPHPFWGYFIYFVYNSMYFVYNLMYFVYNPIICLLLAYWFSQKIPKSRNSDKK